VRYFARFLLVFVVGSSVLPSAYSYSVLAHEAIIDSVWKDSLEPLLLQRFPRATPEDLKAGRAYAYGGSIMQDMGYYPFSARFYTDLTHYVRSGAFVAALLRNAADLNEYAFALGALAHYTSDTQGHPIGINRAVPILYPKLQRKYGDEVTYADDPASHLQTEFGFDVVQVAKGRYAPESYHDFIGFEVSKPLIEKAFLETYGLELKDVFAALDLAIGTYRRTVSGLIPKMTEVAWTIKKDEIARTIPGITRDKFLYNLSRADYEKEWGVEYRRPGFGSRLLGFVLRIIPKIGPFRSLDFRTPTPEAEKLFIESFNATLQQYRARLAEERARGSQPMDLNLDVGKPTTYGMYKMADDAYAELVDRLAKNRFAGIPAELRSDILDFYRDPSAGGKERAKLRVQLEMLRGAAAIR
jgi:hypothetical protein